MANYIDLDDFDSQRNYGVDDLADDINNLMKRPGSAGVLQQRGILGGTDVHHLFRGCRQLPHGHHLGPISIMNLKTSMAMKMMMNFRVDLDGSGPIGSMIT